MLGLTSRFERASWPVALAACVGLIAPSVSLAQTIEVRPRPILSIGGMTEDPHYTLSEVVGGLRLRDGRVLVADRFNNSVRMYDSAGEFIREVGGKGQGPGEYEHIMGFGRCEEGRVVVFDAGWGMVVYDQDLNFVEERPAVVPRIGLAYRFSCAPSGYWIASGWGDRRTQFKAGLFSATAPVLLGRNDRVVVEFGERLSSERIGMVDEAGSPRGSAPHPFGRTTVMALSADRVYLGDGSDYRIEVYDLNGDTLPAITWNGPDRRIRPSDRAAFAQEFLEGVPESMAAARRRALKDMPDVHTFPAYNELWVARDGSLWVREFHRPGTQSTRWVVFKSGTLLGVLDLPASSELLDAGDDYVLLSERNNLDVPSVRLYRLGS